MRVGGFSKCGIFIKCFEDVRSWGILFIVIVGGVRVLVVLALVLGERYLYGFVWFL